MFDARPWWARLPLFGWVYARGYWAGYDWRTEQERVGREMGATAAPFTAEALASVKENET